MPCVARTCSPNPFSPRLTSTSRVQGWRNVRQACVKRPVQWYVHYLYSSIFLYYTVNFDAESSSCGLLYAGQSSVLPLCRCANSYKASRVNAEMPCSKIFDISESFNVAGPTAWSQPTRQTSTTPSENSMDTTSPGPPFHVAAHVSYEMSSPYDSRARAPGLDSVRRGANSMFFLRGLMH